MVYKVMEAKRLRHRVTIQQPVKTVNARGGRTKSWADVWTVWAGIEPLSAREIEQNHQLEGEAEVRIVMRYRRGITTDMRIKYGDRYFKITGILDPDERHKELRLYVVETKDYD